MPFPLTLQGEFKRDLFFLLYRGKEAEFVERLPGEVAVKYKLTPAVEKLLELGADPNLTQPSELTASEDAAYRGSPEILSLLIARNAILARDNHLSAMHYVIKGADIGLKENSSAGSEIPEDFKQCFDILLAHKELLNARDNNECTPLHLLVMHHFRDPYFIDKLVDAGALLGERNKSGNTPLDIMTPEELHQFLNRRIELSEPLESPKTITFDVGFLRYSDDNEIERYDCQSLVILSKSKERRVSWDSLHSAMRCLLKAVIVILSIVLFLEICEGYWDIAIANVAILLTGAEFVLLIGDHPKLA
ncbi:Uncharacterized protein GBIM_09473, partial [Gryllus bimaculatus]